MVIRAQMTRASLNRISARFSDSFMLVIKEKYFFIFYNIFLITKENCKHYKGRGKNGRAVCLESGSDTSYVLFEESFRSPENPLKNPRI